MLGTGVFGGRISGVWLLAFQGEEEMALILEGVPDPSEYDEFGDR